MIRLHTEFVGTPDGPLRVDTLDDDGYLLHDIGNEHRLTRYGARVRLQEAGLDFDAAHDAIADIHRRYAS